MSIILFVQNLVSNGRLSAVQVLWLGSCQMVNSKAGAVVRIISNKYVFLFAISK